MQLRWFVAAVVFVAGLFAGAPVLFYLGRFEVLPWPVLFVLAMSVLAAATGIAITRYRLYDIDRIISRAVSYGLLTALLGGVYAVGAIWLPRFIAPRFQGASTVVAASTLAAAALFRPAHRRIQLAVDRRFGLATTLSRRLRPLRHGCVTRLGWRRYRPICWRWRTEPSSPPERLSGCGQRDRSTGCESG